MYPTHTDDEATVIDNQPHWSSVRALPRPVQKSAALPAPYMLPQTFYSFAEEQSSNALDTECVEPLPLSSIRPDWQLWLAAKWARYAVPFCGAVAGLVLVIGYVALGGEARAVAASASSARSAVVMKVDGPAPTDRDAAVRGAIQMARTMRSDTANLVEVGEAATAGTVVAAEPDEAVDAEEIEMAPTQMVRPAKAKRVRVAKPASTKRGPIKLNASTALGDLRVSRSR